MGNLRTYPNRAAQRQHTCAGHGVAKEQRAGGASRAAEGLLNEVVGQNRSSQRTHDCCQRGIGRHVVPGGNAQIAEQRPMPQIPGVGYSADENQ